MQATATLSSLPACGLLLAASEVGRRFPLFTANTLIIDYSSSKLLDSGLFVSKILTKSLFTKRYDSVVDALEARDGAILASLYNTTARPLAYSLRCKDSCINILLEPTYEL